MIEGEQQFYAIDQKLRPATPEEKAQAAKASNTADLKQPKQLELTDIIARLKEQEENHTTNKSKKTAAITPPSP